MSVRQNNWNKILEIYDYNNKTFFAGKLRALDNSGFRKKQIYFFIIFLRGKKKKRVKEGQIQQRKVFLIIQ